MVTAGWFMVLAPFCHNLYDKIIKKTALVKQKNIVYACLMAPKKSDKSSKEGRFSGRIDPVLLEKFTKAAKIERRSLNAQVAFAMEEYLKVHHPGLD